MRIIDEAVVDAKRQDAYIKRRDAGVIGVLFKLDVNRYGAASRYILDCPNNPFGQGLEKYGY